MDAPARRAEVLRILRTADGPVSAASLAAGFSVSRQIIVGDVALLRASGENIIATPRGYALSSSGAGFIGTAACVHGMDGMEKELNIMVDNGCTVINVIVEHPVYGQITGELHLSSRHDVRQFMDKVSEYGASLLSALTGGVHLHTLSCPDEATFRRTCLELADAGLIYGTDKE
jgi:transcriptional regulator of NAD metabolism